MIIIIITIQINNKLMTTSEYEEKLYRDDRWLSKQHSHWKQAAARGC